MDINFFLNQLRFQRVNKSTSGGGAGSILKVEFDSCWCFIWCTWRIEQNNIVIGTSSDDSEAIIGRIARSARMLENKIVLSIEVSNFFDLIIRLEDGICLRVFCNISYSCTENGREYDVNWEMHIPQKDLSFKINNYFKVEESKYY